jgi:hypothetical protein
LAVRKISTLGLSLAVLAATGWLAQASAQSAPDTSAPAASSDTAAPAADTTPPAKTKAHHAKGSHGKGKAKAATKGDAAVEDLNAQSLDAAKAGKAYAPPTTPVATKAAKPAKTSHHHHKAAKKAAADAAPAPDASAPAPDAGK